jgi:hypothetical protein
MQLTKSASAWMPVAVFGPSIKDRPVTSLKRWMQGLWKRPTVGADQSAEAQEQVKPHGSG